MSTGRMTGRGLVGMFLGRGGWIADMVSCTHGEGMTPKRLPGRRGLEGFQDEQEGWAVPGAMKW